MALTLRQIIAADPSQALLQRLLSGLDIVQLFNYCQCECRTEYIRT